MTGRVQQQSGHYTASAGFTLIEMLVSLALLAVVATMLLEGVAGSAHVARRVSVDQQAGNEVAAAQFVLRGHIAALLPVAQLTGAEATMDVSGTDRMFDFFAAPSMGSGQGGIVKYRLLLTSAGDLVLFQAPELTDKFDLRSPGVVGWHASPILRGAASLSISYFGPTRSDPERKWRNFWQNSVAAPELVRVRVGFRTDDKRNWPDLVVRPLVTVRLDCDPEARTKTCGASS